MKASDPPPNQTSAPGLAFSARSRVRTSPDDMVRNSTWMPVASLNLSAMTSGPP
jgi:uracil DNA glycosylase